MNPIILALLAMSTDFNSNYQCDPLPPKKKCFRDGCENLREGNKMYCSKQCRELHFLDRYGKKTMPKGVL